MGKDLARTNNCLLFCNGGSCVKNGAGQLTREVRAYLRMEGLYNTTHTIKTLCMGRCADGPNMIVLPENTWYKEMTIPKGIELIDQHIKQKEIVEKYLLFQPGMPEVQSEFKLLPESKKEFRLVNDKELGTIAVAHADAWEMNLYPMLMALLIKFYNCIEITTLNERLGSLFLNQPALLDYQNQLIKINLHNWCTELVIGVITKNDTYEIQQNRIHYVAIYKQLEAPFKHGILFRNKYGATKLNVFDRSADLKVWNHFVSIYLEKQPGQIELIKESIENEK